MKVTQDWAWVMSGGTPKSPRLMGERWCLGQQTSTAFNCLTAQLEFDAQLQNLTSAFVGCVRQNMCQEDFSGLCSMWVFLWLFPTPWLFRALPPSPSTATGGDTTGTWVGRTPRRSTVAAGIKWRGGWIREEFVEELGGSKYRLYILSIVHLYVLECT